MSRSQTAEERFDSRYQSDAATGCWNWTGTISHGKRGDARGQLRVNARITLAHRYSFERFNGPIPHGMLVCHRCDNPLCVNPAHLFLGTQLDNMRDMMTKGRNNQPRGERHSQTKLTNSDVLQIRRLAPALGLKSIGRRFGISPSTVHRISTGRSWGWLAEPEREVSNG